MNLFAKRCVKMLNSVHSMKFFSGICTFFGGRGIIIVHSSVSWWSKKFFLVESCIFLVESIYMLLAIVFPSKLRLYQIEIVQKQFDVMRNEKWNVILYRNTMWIGRNEMSLSFLCHSLFFPIILIKWCWLKQWSFY